MFLELIFSSINKVNFFIKCIDLYLSLESDFDKIVNNSDENKYEDKTETAVENCNEQNINIQISYGK